MFFLRASPLLYPQLYTKPTKQTSHCNFFRWMRFDRPHLKLSPSQCSVFFILNHKSHISLMLSCQSVCHVLQLYRYNIKCIKTSVNCTRFSIINPKTNVKTTLNQNDARTFFFVSQEKTDGRFKRSYKGFFAILMEEGMRWMMTDKGLL